MFNFNFSFQIGIPPMRKRYPSAGISARVRRAFARRGRRLVEGNFAALDLSSRKIMQDHAKSCKIMQNHAKSCKIMQNYAGNFQQPCGLEHNAGCRQLRNCFSCPFLDSCCEKEWLILPELDAAVSLNWILAEHFAWDALERDHFDWIEIETTSAPVACSSSTEIHVFEWKLFLSHLWKMHFFATANSEKSDYVDHIPSAVYVAG